MTVTTIDRRMTYAGNGVAVAFAGPRIFDVDDLAVFRVVANVATLLTRDVDYTVTGVGLAGSTVTMTVAPANGESLLLLRSVEPTQPSRFGNQGAFFPEIHEREFDRAAMRDQQVFDELQRTFRLSDSYLGDVNLVLPAPVPYALLGWSAGGDALQTFPPGDAAQQWYTPSFSGSHGRPLVEKLGETISLLEFAVGDGVTDDTAAFEAFIDALQATGRTGWVPKATYLLGFPRRRALTVDMRIVCDPAAVFKGTPTLNDFPGTGAQTLFTATFPPGNDGYNVVRIVAGVPTVLTKNTHYTVTGQVINTAGGSAPIGAPAVGETLRIVSANPVIELGANVQDGCSIDWQGGRIDSSARGYAVNVASGSGLVLYNFRRGSVRDTYFYASDDWAVASAAGVGGDSGLVPIACSTLKVASCLFRGWADCGVYAGGNSGGAEADDGWGVDVDDCGFYRCQQAVAIKRAGQSSHIHHCWALECTNGFAFLPTGDNLVGARGSIHDNYGRRIGRLFIDVRGSVGTDVHDNMVIDFGYKPDGVTATGTPTAISFQGVTRGMVHDNLALLVDWNNAAGQRGISFGKDTTLSGLETTNSIAHHNKFVGLATGIIESGAGSGNSYPDNEIVNCTTPASGVSLWARGSYWDGTVRRSLVTGIATPALQPEEGVYTPTLTNQTNVSASTAYACQWSRVGRTVTVSGKVDITCTANSSVTELRLSLPVATANFAGSENLGGTASPLDVVGAGASAGGFLAEAAGQTARLRFMSGTSATASRTWYFSFSYRIQ